VTHEAASAVIAKSNAIHESLWQQAKSVMAKDSAVVPTGLFIQSLTEMIDNYTKRVSAVTNNVPNIVLLILYGVAMVRDRILRLRQRGAESFGRDLPLRRRRDRLHRDFANSGPGPHRRQADHDRAAADNRPCGQFEDI
jgi:hypothetical protein